LDIPYLQRRRNEMNRQLVKIVLGICVVIVGLLAIVTYMPDRFANVEAAEAALDAEAARWIGRGGFHLAKADAALDAEAARWIGRGDYHLAKANAALDAEAARWIGRGDYHLAKADTALDAEAARWIGRGDYHLAKAEAALDAEAARWIGRGDYHLAKADAALDALVEATTTWRKPRPLLTLKRTAGLAGLGVTRGMPLLIKRCPVM
jgi:hypothetical protein